MTRPDRAVGGAGDGVAADRITGAATDVTVAAETSSLTLAAERLRVDVRTGPHRRVRLEKYVVTEVRTVTVEVSREEVRLVEVDPADGPDASSVSDRDDVGRWLVLHEERVEVTTRVVPVERVRLQVDTVTAHREVTAPVRVERLGEIEFAPLSTPTTD